MFFKYYFLLALPIVSVKAQEQPNEEASLVSLPDTCVALREGRNCYADVKVSWHQPKGNYCLRDGHTKHIMQCWLMQQTGLFRYQFDSAETVNFELVNSNNGKVVDTTEIQVQWVYQNRQKKRRWRLF